MNIQTLLESKVKEGFLTLFETTLPSVEFQSTRKDFEGDITIVVFPMLRYKKGNPAKIPLSETVSIPFSTPGINSFGIAPPLIALSTSLPFPGSCGSTNNLTFAN